MGVVAETVLLLGRDSTVFGEVTSAEVGRAGVALSRGRFPKPKMEVDPNEDAVLAACDGDRWLLVAADGHFGFEAALAAMQAIEALAPSLLFDSGKGQAIMIAAIERAREAVATALSGVDDVRARSRTALSAVLVRGEEIFATTCGDSSIFLIGPTRVRQVTTTSRFLGPRTPPPPVLRARLKRAEGIAVVTDGFTDYLGRASAPALCRAMAGGMPAQSAASLVHAAFAGGAGDNVGVAVLMPAG